MTNFKGIIENLKEKDLRPEFYLPENFYIYSDIIKFLKKFKELLKKKSKKINEDILSEILNKAEMETIKLIRLDVIDVDPESEGEILERISNFESTIKIVKEEIINSYKRYLTNIGLEIGKYYLDLTKEILEE